MDIKMKKTYSQVYGILEMLGENYITKLPSSLYKMINEERQKEYTPQYDSSIALEKQDIKKESLSMIALFHLNYWCNSQDEKNKLRKLFQYNEEKYQNELREKYNPDNLFKNKSQTIEKKEITSEPVAIIEYKENILKKLINKIKNIFHIR